MGEKKLSQKKKKEEEKRKITHSLTTSIVFRVLCSLPVLVYVNMYSDVPIITPNVICLSCFKILQPGKTASQGWWEQVIIWCEDGKKTRNK